MWRECLESDGIGKVTLANESVTTHSLPSRGIPPEIIDLIVACLYDDWSSLKACACVCRLWLYFSRCHFPTSFSISWLRKSHYSRLVELVEDPHSTIAYTIRSLIIDSKADWSTSVKSETGGACFALAQPPQNWSDSVMESLGRMSSIKGLTLRQWNSISGWKILRDTHSFTAQITHLTLSDIRFDSWMQWMETICCFSSLVYLRDDFGFLRSRHVEEGALIYPETILLPPRCLSELEITSYVGTCPIQLAWSQLIWKWLLEGKTQLTTLALSKCISKSIDEDWNGSFVPFVEYFRCLKPSLKNFKIDFDDSMTISRFFKCLNLKPDFALQSVDLGSILLRTYHCPPRFEDKFLSLPSIISGFSGGAHLEKVVFKIDQLKEYCFVVDHLARFSPANQDDVDMTWQIIDDLLISSKFPALEKVVFMLQVPPEWFNAEDYLGQKLPKCKEMGILRIDHAY